VFEVSQGSPEQLASQLEAAITTQFTHEVRVLIKTPEQLGAISQAIPPTVKNDAVTKCDVLLLWPEVDRPEILEQIPSRLDIDNTKYVPGAVIHIVAKKDATKSRVSRIIGTELYKHMTLRNINTVRKLIELSS
jgi:uncharacterized protein (DUF1697 family)